MPRSIVGRALVRPGGQGVTAVVRTARLREANGCQTVGAWQRALVSTAHGVARVDEPTSTHGAR